MATETLVGPLGELRAASTAGGGTAVTSTAARLLLPLGTKWVGITPRNFAGAVVLQYNFNPWLTVLKTTNLLATEAALTDYSDEAQDGSTATDVTLSSLDTLANLDALYVGALVPFGGVEIDVDAANGTNNTLLVEYWNGSAWADISATDGTDTGASLAQDGNVTWTVPSDWVSIDLVTAQTATATRALGILKVPQYWTRWSWSAALDASTTLNSMLAINRSTAYAELAAGQAFEEAITVGPGGVASVTLKADAGTCNAIVNVATRQGGRFV